ncbi:MAG: MmgE/PrpD family protein [Alphaproteobacteria bacterium]|nr:MmgE/PrpD family protein [Alphaproteobacteria bacterium]
MDKTARQLVEFTRSIDYGDLSKATRQAAKTRMIDTMGCAMAALLAPPVRVARRLAVPIAGDSGSRLFGTLTRTTPDLAGFVNGAMVRYLDMSDAFLMTSTAHPSDNIPSLMALAEATGASGKDLLLATVISYEIQCRLCDAAPFQAKGWDQPVAGAPAAALAAGRLLGLDAKKLRHALALAVVPNVALNQTRSGQLSMWKGMAGPNAARQGVFAAQLAAAGMTGPEDPIDGKFGLWAQTMGETYTVKIPQRFKGHTFAVRQTNIKSFPVRDAIQVPIMAALKLRKKIAADNIETLRIDTYAKHFAVAAKDRALWAPKTRESADHSLPFCVAAALIDGAVTPETFERARYLDKDCRALMKRVCIDFVDAYDKVAPETRTCRLLATVKGGKTVTVQHRQTPADILRGPSDAEVEAKFHRLAERTLDENARQNMLKKLWSLERQRRIDPIVELTGI